MIKLQPFFPASAVTNFGLPVLGSGQWLSSRMFLQEEKSCRLWPWRGLPGSGGDTPPKHPETYITLPKRGEDLIWNFFPPHFCFFFPKKMGSLTKMILK